MNIMHFNSQKERLAFLKGEFEEIILQKAEEPTVEDIVPKAEETPSEDSTESSAVDSKPKAKKSKKKKEKKDEASVE